MSTLNKPLLSLYVWNMKMFPEIISHKCFLDYLGFNILCDCGIKLRITIWVRNDLII